MITVISFFLFWSMSTLACELDATNEYLSLSGPISFALEELGLLEDSRLKGVSVFHKVKTMRSNLTRVGGGLFLSSKELTQYKNLVVFHDESRELKRNLENAFVKNSIEIRTALKDPFEVHTEAMSKLSPYLKNCERPLKKLNKKIDVIKDKIVAKKFKNPHLVFYLGDITYRRRPDMVMVADGPLKYLIKLNKVKTYPSSLAYVRWSEKIMNSLPKQTMHLGLKEVPREKLKLKQVKALHYNLEYRGIFIPGIRQIYFLDQLVEVLD